MHKLTFRSSRKRKTEPLRLILDRISPALVPSIMDVGYRQKAIEEKAALHIAVQLIRLEYATEGERLENEFCLCGKTDDAEKIAAKLSILNVERAISAFGRSLVLKKENAGIRLVAARGLADIARTAECKRESNLALDMLAKAANRGISEAIDVIETRLKNFFHIKDGTDTQNMLFRLATAIRSPTLKVAAATASAMAFLCGSAFMGCFIGIFTLEMHLVQKIIEKH